MSWHVVKHSMFSYLCYGCEHLNVDKIFCCPDKTDGVYQKNEEKWCTCCTQKYDNTIKHQSQQVQPSVPIFWNPEKKTTYLLYPKVWSATQQADE